MDIKELKAFKEEIANKLKDLLNSLISGPKISVNISDDLERLYIVLLTERKNNDNTIAITENNFIFDTKQSDNIVFQGSSKTMIYRDSKLSGMFTDNVQIDLMTLYTIQQAIYNFALENDLLENDTTKKAAVGDNEE